MVLPIAAWVYCPWVYETWEKDCAELGPFPMPPSSGHCTVLRALGTRETYEVEVEFVAPPATHVAWDDDGKPGDRRCYNWDDIRVQDTTGNYTWVVLE